MPESDSERLDNGPDRTDSGNRFQVLGFEQVQRLHRLMDTEMPIHGRGNFPTLHIKLSQLVQVVRDRLKAEDITVRDIRLNGGAASFILGNETSEVYNDLDLIFSVDLSSENDLRRVKDVVMSSLLHFMPAGVSRERISTANLSEAYVRKLMKVYDEQNRWSLISLSNVQSYSARNVELKFADRIRRQFEFSVDSFQIMLDSLLTFYAVCCRSMSEHFYPTVIAESVYGSFDIAIDHLNRKLIATRNPEQIRGGGLLKYCNLIVRNFRPTKQSDVHKLERYMCSRFFIDFPDIEAQRVKLQHYLTDHFSDDLLRHRYLTTLWMVINSSTVCLMGHERRLTLSLISNMAQTLLNRHTMQKALDLVSPPASSPANGNLAPPTATLFDQSAVDLVIDQVYYGPFCCPPIGYCYSNLNPYAVCTYEYSGSSTQSSPQATPSQSPCCDVIMTPSESSSCCSYCKACCFECAATAASEL